MPARVARDVVAALSTRSAALELGNVTPIPSSTMRVPVVSVEPEAGFVTGIGGRKPFSPIEWTGEQLIAEELAVTLSVPDAFLDDDGFPVWHSVRDRITAAFARAIDAAVFFGAGAPASFPTGGIAAIAGAAVTGETALDALDTALGQIEASGAEPSGIAASSAIGAVLRSAYRDAGALPGVQPERSIYGLPVARAASWDDLAGDALAGAFETSLIIGVRRDIAFELSTDGVLTDETGEIVVNAFQDDSTLMRAFMRLGCVIGLPVGPGGDPIEPFRFVSFTAVPPGAPAEAASSGSKRSAKESTGRK
jgi:HK97 family phage major capsid protein